MCAYFIFYVFNLSIHKNVFPEIYLAGMCKFNYFYNRIIYFSNNYIGIDWFVIKTTDGYILNEYLLYLLSLIIKSIYF